MPGLFRTGRRLRPGLLADQGRGGRRRLPDFRPKNLDLDRGPGGHDLLSGTDRARRAEARRHLLHPVPHDHAGDRGATAEDHDRVGGVQRGVLHRCACAAERGGGRARAGVVRGQCDPETRARHAGGPQRHRGAVRPAGGAVPNRDGGRPGADRSPGDARPADAASGPPAGHEVQRTADHHRLDDRRAGRAGGHGGEAAGLRAEPPDRGPGHRCARGTGGAL